MYEYKGFVAKIEKEGSEFKGFIFGIDVEFTESTLKKAEARFHKIVDENLPDDD